MKSKILSCLPTIFCLLLGSALPAFTQGTAFTYQGRLNNGGSLANGSFDLKFSAYDTNQPINNLLAGPVTNAATLVSNGLFVVSLDFGAGIFTGPARWVEIGVRTNGSVSSFAVLSPRQQITPTPMAIFASTAANATAAGSVSANAVTAAGIQDGVITASKLAPGQVVKSLNGLTDFVSLSAGANVTLTTNGNSLQVAASGGATSGWALGGNGGTQSTNFLGTSDNQPLELRVNSQRALRLEPNTSGAPNIVGGASVNFVAAGVKGAVIGGGGATNYSGVPYTNSVAADFSTVSGGFANSIQANAGTSTVGGGFLNTIQPGASTSTIGGGYVNTIGTNAYNSTIGGGSGNVVQPGAASGTIGGGGNNVIQPNAVLSTIGGGLNNSNLANAAYATIPGGAFNVVGGSYGFAAGHRAKAVNQGAFVWADSLDADFFSAANDEFAIRAAGGVRISDSSPGLFFGTTTRQMLNLFQTGYGIGVQNYTVYERSGGGFAWYLGGSHTNAQNNPGPGGTTLMSLDPYGDLTAAGTITASQGLYGTSVGGSLSSGVSGFDTGSYTNASGVYGSSAIGNGVSGSGGNRGVYGITSSPGQAHAGVFGENSAVGGTGVVGNALNNYSAGVAGVANTVGSTGVYGSGTSYGVSGNSIAGYGVSGNSTTSYGVYGNSTSFDGVKGYSTSGSGVSGTSTDGDGVYGHSSKGDPSHAGVFGVNDAVNGNGVVGACYNINSAGVAGVADTAGSTGVYGRGNLWAGYFDGRVSVCSLEIRGGCDVAEPFQMSHQEIPKGSVVVIDDENAGQLKLSDRAYDSRVAGIVSGANGINPGVSLHQEGVMEGGQNVALSGRVYVLADASTGAIKPGDLLTTSDTPGHAMKVTNHNHAQGAILGKAMSSLKQGKGMVLVLVTLQ